MPALSQQPRRCSSGTMADAVRNTVEEYGPENLHARRRADLQRPVPDRHPRQRRAASSGRSSTTARSSRSSTSGRTSSTWAASCPGGFARHQAQRLRERPGDRARSCSTASDKPVKSAFSLIFDNARFGGAAAAGHQDDLREPAARRAADAGDDRALRRSTPCTARCATRATCRPRRCATALGAAARRRLRGRGRASTPTASTTPRTATRSRSRSPSAATASRST